MKIILILIITSFTAVPAQAFFGPITLNFPEPYDKIVEGKDVNVYGDDSFFVEWPAKTGFILGDTIGVLVGFPTGFIIGFPFFLFLEETTLAGAYLGWYITGIPLREGLGALLSAPFYGLKKAFWDGPIYLWESISDEEKSILTPSDNPASPSS